MVTNPMVSSHLDYCNSLLRSFSSKNIKRFQNIQNCLACFVSGDSRFTHITPTLKSLHSLPVNNNSSSKSLVLIPKYLTTGKPKYFAPYLSLYASTVKQEVSIQKRCFSRFFSTVPQFINLKIISTSASHMMLHNFGMICHWRFELLLHFHDSKGDLRPVLEVLLSLVFF